ncbi:MAG TPA: ABC transporter permease [Luteitalea sp.]|nr:ABC transporter permease [Luteitalea sp.]
MRTVFLASLRTHARRYVAAAIAVVVSVAFLVVIGVLSAGVRRGLMETFGAPFRNADHIVDGDPVETDLDTTAAVAMVERLGDRASGLGRVSVAVQSGGWRGETTIGPVAASEALRWQELVAGRFPERPGEAVMHLWDAQEHEVTIGSVLHVGDGPTAVDLRVVGHVLAPSPVAQASVYVTWPQYLHWRNLPTFHVSRVAVRGDAGPVPAGAALYVPENYVRNGVALLNNRTDTLALMLLLFAGVAISVSVLVIANTLSILLAQRLRDFALLRCVGATRQQVVHAVRAEAAAVGALASVAGVLVGGSLGYGLISTVNTLVPRVPIRTPGLPYAVLLAGFVVGLAVTLVASWLPIRRVLRVSPLAALRPDVGDEPTTSRGRIRFVLALCILVAGLVLLVVSVVLHSMPVMLTGGAGVFGGILLLGPVIVPRLVRLVGAPLTGAGRLAITNAVRNPRRTATTTSSLLLGVTVTSAMLTGLATSRTAVDERRHRQHPLDATITSTAGSLPPGLLDQVRRTVGVGHAIAVEGTAARVSGLDDVVPVLVAPAAAEVARDGGAFARVAPGVIALDRGAFRRNPNIQPGASVTVHAGERTMTLRVVVGRGWGRVGMVSAETLAALTTTPTLQAIWIRASPDADAITLVDAIDDLADPVGARVDDELQARATEEQQMRLLTWSVVALLGISVVIALIGIANTLGLSVLERTREHALLRALGLTRGQLRRMLALEAMLLSIVATALGTVMGVAFAWVGYMAVLRPALEDARMQIPWLSLAAVVVVATLAGLIASVLPSRRAANVAPAAGLSFD